MNDTEQNVFMIPEGTTKIESWEFAGKEFSSIIIPESVTTVADNAFEGCGMIRIQYRGYHFSFDGSRKTGMNNYLLILREKDFSVRMPVPLKARLLFEMYLSVPDQETTAYIRKNFKKLFKALIDLCAVEIAKDILESGQFVNKKNIDDLIQYAIKTKAYEIQVMLMDYKVQKIGYDNIETTSKNKLDL